MNETNQRLQYLFAVVCWDLEKFYDSICLHRLIASMLALSCPPAIIVMTFTMYLAPRFLRGLGSVAEPIYPANSILQGCGFACHFARGLLRSLLYHVHRLYPVELTEFVDDITHKVEGTRASVPAGFSSVGGTCGQGIACSGLTVSLKSGMAASSRDFGRLLLNTLAESDVRMGLQDHIRDLGLDAYTGRRPRKRIALRWRHSAALRAGKVSYLRSRNAPGRRLFLGGVYPQSMYGVQQFGLSPTAVRTLRRQAARACSTLGQGTCLTSLLALEMGEHDPAKKVVRDVLELWIDIWLHLTAAQRKRVYRSWDLAKPRIVSATRRQRWHRVKGPLTATIATLCELQWDPQGPAPWTTVDGDRTKRQIFSWPVSQGLYGLCNASTTALAAVKLQLTQPASVVKRTVLRLSCTDTGYVLETCLTIPTKRPSGRTRDFLFEPKRRQWTRPVCGFVASYQLILRRGCCRRRLPRRRQWSLEREELLHLATSFETVRCIGIQTAAAANMAKMRGLSELVGVQLVSRARYLSFREQRPGELKNGPLPGELQGSDRAEIWALLQLLKRTLGDLVVGTDCDYLVKCFYKRWWARKGCFKNGDLWCRLGTALNRRRRVIVYKVKAHVLAPDSPLELAAHSWTSVVGNELADAFAEKGALLHEVPIDVVRAVSEADFLAVRIQKQLYTTAIQAVPELKGSAKAQGSRETRRLTLPQLMAATDHDLLRDPLKVQRQWHCSRCGHTIVHAGQPVLIGLQATHGSHKLACKRGIWWCVACGSWASSAARNLSRPCTGQATKGSERCSGSFGHGAHAETPHPVAVSASLKGASKRSGVWDPHETPGADPRTVHCGLGSSA